MYGGGEHVGRGGDGMAHGMGYGLPASSEGMMPQRQSAPQTSYEQQVLSQPLGFASSGGYMEQGGEDAVYDGRGHGGAARRGEGGGAGQEQVQQAPAPAPAPAPASRSSEEQWNAVAAYQIQHSTSSSSAPQNDDGAGYGQEQRRAATAEELSIVTQLLHRLFTPTVAEGMLQRLYGGMQTVPVPLGPTASEELHEGGGLGPIKEPSECWARLDVDEFPKLHYAKSPLPAFKLSLRCLDGTALPRGQSKEVVDIRVRLDVWNKWACVTDEVISDSTLDIVLKDGSATIDGLVFRDVSIKHGGFFVFKATPVDFADEIRPWRSSKLTIRSSKTHFTKRKRERSVGDTIDTGASTPQQVA